jgi:hypothetical protein
MVASRRRPLGGGFETDSERRGPLAPRHSIVLKLLVMRRVQVKKTSYDETYKSKEL